MEDKTIKKRVFKKLVVTITVIGIILSVVIFVYSVEKYVMPVAAELCLNNAKSLANDIINEAVRTVLAKHEEEFKEIFRMNNGNSVTMITVDTKFVNAICTEISDYINKEMYDLDNNNVSVPYGAASGISFMANKGPKIVFEIMPDGNSEVDYETEFVSAGINQTNYKIWLTVEISVSLINPIYEKNMIMTRKIMLADMVINGEVPDYYNRLTE